MTLKDIFAGIVGMARPHPNIPDKVVEVFMYEFEKGGYFFSASQHDKAICMIFGKMYNFWELMEIKKWKEKYEA